MTNPKNIYVSIVSAAKKASRDVARSRWVMNLIEKRKSYEQSNSKLEKLDAELRKNLEIAEFDASHAKEIGNPRAEDLAEVAKNVREHVESNLKSNEELRERNNKEIKRLNQEIEEVANGKKKVNREKMLERAKSFLEERLGKAFVDGKFDESGDNTQE